MCTVTYLHVHCSGRTATAQQSTTPQGCTLLINSLYLQLVLLVFGSARSPLRALHHRAADAAHWLIALLGREPSRLSKAVPLSVQSWPRCRAPQAGHQCMDFCACDLAVHFQICNCKRYCVVLVWQSQQHAALFTRASKARGYGVFSPYMILFAGKPKGKGLAPGGCAVGSLLYAQQYNAITPLQSVHW